MCSSEQVSALVSTNRGQYDRICSTAMPQWRGALSEATGGRIASNSAPLASRMPFRLATTYDTDSDQVPIRIQLSEVELLSASGKQWIGGNEGWGCPDGAPRLVADDISDKQKEHYDQLRNYFDCQGRVASGMFSS
jgi:hypothetical protein